MTDNINNLREALLASPGAWRLFQADCAREFPDGAASAIRTRMSAGWASLDDIRFALDRAEGLTDAEITALILAEQAAIDALYEEDERREAEARRKMKEAA